MIRFTAKQQKQLARKIRACKNKRFPERGGGKELAALLGVSPQLLTNWMAGTRLPSALQLAKMARIFDISIQELCSLPCEKRKSKVPDLVVSLTKYHEGATRKGVNNHEERKRLNMICSFIYNELERYM
ncbi:MAG: helix-turn-helix transcriptional regulator [Planctomycetota bacterium]|jgi:transcriptional regulator with XRE-family HTH domain|nr:helix-turn-helix transcriptional regulator [Planctomycetota bacterium]